MNKLFEFLKPAGEPEPATPDPEAQAQATQTEQVKLQSRIDQFNAQITQWDNQRTLNRTKAKAAKASKNTLAATTLLQQNQLLTQQIDTALNSVSMLLQKQASLTKSSMLTNTHNALQDANQHISANVKQIGVRDIEKGLMQNGKLDDDLLEIGSYMKSANPMNGRSSKRTMEAELAGLSSEEGVETSADEDIGSRYDFPDLKFPSTATATNSTNASTSTVKSTQSTGLPTAVRINNNNNNTNSNTTSNLALFDF